MTSLAPTSERTFEEASSAYLSGPIAKDPGRSQEKEAWYLESINPA